ncbi:unnamed protein product [Auanema sp. JU1783]|nr:unnamed protein product [Auanema sp. JU1783]
MSTNQDPNVQQVMMYQQAGFAGYQTGNNNVGTWSQQQPQTMFPIAFQGEVSSYGEKNAYTTYNPMQFCGNSGESDYYRSQYATGTPYSHAQPTAQWSQQPAYQTATGYASQQPIFGTYAAADQREATRGPTFNPGAPPPNMNRPPPILKRENGDNTFHASLSVLENPAQTAAAYTASWVSSTSSIPPDLKDEPEYGNLPRDDMNVFANFSDQFNTMTIHDSYKTHRDIGQWDNKPNLHSQQWPGLGQQDDASRNKKHDRDRRPREDARELTWDERLRKAQVHKERVEQNGEKVERERFEQMDRNRGSLRGRGGRAGFRGIDNRDNRARDGENNRFLPNILHDSQNRGGFRGRGAMANGRGGNVGPPIGPPPMNPVIYQGQPSVLFQTRGAQFVQGPSPHPPPHHLVNVPQDERFKNTWLDANAYYPYPVPFAPMPYGMDPRFARGRGFSGPLRGGRTFGTRNGKKDDERKLNNDESSFEEHEKSPEMVKEVPVIEKDNDESSKKENVETSS